MPDDPQMRASDADRDRAATLLREHHAAGRLNPEEFQERLDATFEAKTLGDLDRLLADLPGIDLYQLPEASMRRAGFDRPVPPAATEHGRLSPHWRAAWGSWASVSLLLFVIWLISAIGGGGNLHSLWFLWISGPWGALLLGRWLFGGSPSGPHRQVSGPAVGGRAELRPDPGASPRDRHEQRHTERHDRHREHRDGGGPGNS
jgi:hypothetical protein